MRQRTRWAQGHYQCWDHIPKLLTAWRLPFATRLDLTLYLLFEHQQIFDGDLVDDRSNSTNPGGTDVFGRAAHLGKPGLSHRALLD